MCMFISSTCQVSALLEISNNLMYGLVLLC